MIVFLTSSPTGPLDGAWDVEGMDQANNFRYNLQKVWKPNSKVLMISATPYNYEQNDEMTNFFHQALMQSGLSVEFMDCLDKRWEDVPTWLIHMYDVIFLGGGHVPTQNSFFNEISLREKLIGYNGIVIGISAGSMNAADIVYAQPEEAYEAIDPNYIKYLNGLNLTPLNILPHWQMVRNTYRDGRHLENDITYWDSMNHTFYALNDGSYVLIDEHTTIYGEAYKYENGHMECICKNGASIRII